MKAMITIIALVLTSLTSQACNLDSDALKCLVGKWDKLGCKFSKQPRAGARNSWTSIWTFKDGRKVTGEFKYYSDSRCTQLMNSETKNMDFELGSIVSIGDYRAVQVIFKQIIDGDSVEMRDLLSVTPKGNELFWGKETREMFPTEIDSDTHMEKIDDKKPQNHIRENEASSTYGELQKINV